MAESGKRLFVGLKISAALQNDLNNPAPGTERYFKGDDPDYLQIVSLGDEKFIGRYIKDGFPVTDIDNVSRNIRSILRLVTRGRSVEDNAVHIYSV